MRIYCQTCGALNRDDQEYCVRCHQKLLVLSGGARDDAKQLVIKPVRPRGRGQFQDQNQDQKWPR